MARTKKNAPPPAQAVDVFEQPVPAPQAQEPTANSAHEHLPGATLPPTDSPITAHAHNVENVAGLGGALAKMESTPASPPPSPVMENAVPHFPAPPDSEEKEDPDDDEEEEDIAPPPPKRYRCKEKCRFMNRLWEPGDYLPPSDTPRMIPSYFEEDPK